MSKIEDGLLNLILTPRQYEHFSCQSGDDPLGGSVSFQWGGKYSLVYSHESWNMLCVCVSYVSWVK